MINQDCRLILRDLYSYDIQSAHATILQKQNFDFKNVDLEDKKQRNIFIGQQQIGNENLSQFLMESVDSLVKYYLKENNVSGDEIITIQKDGCILKRMLDVTDDFIELKYRGFIDFLILTPDRKKYLYLSDGKIVVKGMSHFYEELNKVYQLFANISFYDKSFLFEQMEHIKQMFYYSDDKKLFLIPREERSFVISTYKGDIETKDAEMISMNQINRDRYFNHYVKDFLNSIFLECY
jgi:hypothetical protein